MPAFADWGVFCRTIALDPSIYLHYLQSKCLELGVRFRRASVAHIRDAFSVRFGDQPADQTVAEVVVNCTGTLAARLGGVEDEAMVPMRGQLVVVENESVGGMFSVSGDDNMHEEVGECCYIINRPSGKFSPRRSHEHTDQLSLDDGKTGYFPWAWRRANSGGLRASSLLCRWRNRAGRLLLPHVVAGA